MKLPTVTRRSGVRLSGTTPIRVTMPRSGLGELSAGLSMSADVFAQMEEREERRARRAKADARAQDAEALRDADRMNRSRVNAAKAKIKLEKEQNEYTAQQTQWGVDKAVTGINVDIAQAQRENPDGMIPMEVLPTEVQEKLGIKKGTRIPAHTVIPELRYARTKEAIHEAAENITNLKDREKFINDNLAVADKTYVSDIEDSAAQGKQIRADRTKAQAAEYARTGQHAKAAELYRQSRDIPEEEKQKKIAEFAAQGEETSYQDAINGATVENPASVSILEDAKKILALPYKEYQKKGGTLSEDAKTAMLNKVEGRITAVTNEQKAAIKLAYDGVIDQAAKLTKAIPLGDVNQQQYAAVKAQLTNMAEVEKKLGLPSRAAKSLDKLETQAQVKGFVLNLSPYTFSEGRKIVEGEVKKSGGNPDVILKADAVLNSLKAMETLWATNTVEGYEARTGLKSKSINTSPDTLTSNEVRTFMFEAGERFKALIDEYSDDGVEDMLTRSQSMDIANSMRGATVEDRAVFGKMMVEALGVNAKFLYDQWKKEGVVSKKEVERWYLEGKLPPHIIGEMEEGAKSRAKDADWIKMESDEGNPVRTLIRDTYREKLVGLNKQWDIDQYDGRKEFVTDLIYRRSGGNPNEVTEDMINGAIDSVYGETGEFRGYTLQAPSAGTSLEVFSDTVTDVNYRDLIRKGYYPLPGNPSANQVTQYIKSGAWQLKKHSDNLYYIYDSNNKPLMGATPSGSNAIPFLWNVEDMYTNEDYSRDKTADDLEKGVLSHPTGRGGADYRDAKLGGASALIGGGGSNDLPVNVTTSNSRGTGLTKSNRAVGGVKF